jgi:5-methylcytosine-specific restriction protein A
MTRDPRLWTTAYRHLRVYVLDRDHHTCQIRGPRCTTVATVVDHVVDRADGGALYHTTNLRAACAACNGWRSATRTNAIRSAARSTGRDLRL